MAVYSIVLVSLKIISIFISSFLNSMKRLLYFFWCSQIEFEGEEGTGLGPTLEFYSLVGIELQRKSLAIWMCDDTASLNKEEKMGDSFIDEKHEIVGSEFTKSVDDAVTTTGSSNAQSEGPKLVYPDYIWAGDRGLFPAPYPPETEINKVQEHFFLIGALFGKVLQDGRKIDVPISEHVLRLLVSPEVPRDSKMNMDNVEKWLMSALEGSDKTEFLKDAVSEHVLKFMQQLQQLVYSKAEILSREKLTNVEKKKLIDKLMLMHGDTQLPLEDLQ